MSQILVPVDFTKASIEGIKKAIKIAKSNGGEIHLLNIVSPITSNPDESPEVVLDHTLNLLKENESKLSDLLESIDDQGVELHSEIVVDHLKPAIHKYLKKHDVELIVVGVNGAHTVGDLFLKNDEKNHKVVEVSCPVEVAYSET
ncbi:MAG: universal stress protein [Fulvivirga sp.]|nr:universal stress protein [Fulvivirga sp.]